MSTEFLTLFRRVWRWTNRRRTSRSLPLMCPHEEFPSESCLHRTDSYPFLACAPRDNDRDSSFMALSKDSWLDASWCEPSSSHMTRCLVFITFASNFTEHLLDKSNVKNCCLQSTCATEVQHCCPSTPTRRPTSYTVNQCLDLVL